MSVYGVPNEFLGEAVKAVIVPTDEAAIGSPQPLLRALRQAGKAPLSDKAARFSLSLRRKSSPPR